MNWGVWFLLCVPPWLQAVILLFGRARVPTMPLGSRSRCWPWNECRKPREVVPHTQDVVATVPSETKEGDGGRE